MAHWDAYTPSDALMAHPLWAGGILSTAHRMKALTWTMARTYFDNKERCDDITGSERQFIALFRADQAAEEAMWTFN